MMELNQAASFSTKELLSNKKGGNFKLLTVNNIRALHLVKHCDYLQVSQEGQLLPC